MLVLRFWQLFGTPDLGNQRNHNSFITTSKTYYAFQSESGFSCILVASSFYWANKIQAIKYKIIMNFTTLTCHIHASILRFYVETSDLLPGRGDIGGRLNPMPELLACMVGVLGVRFTWDRDADAAEVAAAGRAGWSSESHLFCGAFTFLDIALIKSLACFKL